MERLFRSCLSIVLGLIMVAVFWGGATHQEASADNGLYGKYVLSTDSTQYIELKPDGSCLLGVREYTPSGKTGKLELLSGTYEIKGDTATFNLNLPRGSLKSEFRVEGNTLVPKKERLPRGLEGAKYIKR